MKEVFHMEQMSSGRQNPAVPSKTEHILRVVGYLAGKALTIAITIYASVFITVLLASQPSRRGLGPPVSPFETSIEAQIYQVVRASVNGGFFGQDADPEEIAALTEQLRTEMGLNLPFLPRNMLWTAKALTFDWGKLGQRYGGWMSGGRTTAERRTTSSWNTCPIHCC